MIPPDRQLRTQSRQNSGTVVWSGMSYSTDDGAEFVRTLCGRPVMPLNGIPAFFILRFAA